MAVTHKAMVDTWGPLVSALRHYFERQEKWFKKLKLGFLVLIVSYPYCNNIPRARWFLLKNMPNLCKALFYEAIRQLMMFVGWET